MDTRRDTHSPGGAKHVSTTVSAQEQSSPRGVRFSMPSPLLGYECEKARIFRFRQLVMVSSRPSHNLLTRLGRMPRLGAFGCELTG